MTVALGILIIMVVLLLVRNASLRSERNFYKKGKQDSDSAVSVYFNQLLQYRDILIKNNLYQPAEGVEESTNGKNTFTIDSILDEIAEKGIENISEDKLNFLKNNQNGKDK